MATLVGRMLGRYRLEALLGQGGMAEVYRASDTKLARTVAVKVILEQHARDPHFVERFLREARVVASLEHPHILSVYDFGEEDGSVYIVMPFMDGGTLRDRMLGGPIPLAQASAWIRQLAEALDAAHERGVLHRDVKPANVLMGKGERLALADFGIAKILEAETGLTATGVVVGTPVYMAPEQAQGRPATAASDRYALAVLSYELLSGKPPFDGESALALMHQHVATPPPALSTKVRGLPAGLDTIFERALAKEPEDRPPSCRALADAIGTFAPTGAFVASVAAAPATAVTSPTVLQPNRPPSGPLAVGTPSRSLTSAATVDTASSPSRGRALALVGIGAVLAAGTLLVLSRLHPAPSPVPLGSVPAPTATPAMRAAASPTPLSAATAPPAVAVVELPAKAAPGAASVPKAPPVAPRPPDSPLQGHVPAGDPDAAASDEEPGAGNPLHEAHRRLDPSRTGHRPSREDFAFVLASAEQVLSENPRKSEARFLRAYAKAGLAYLDGREAEAGLLLAGALLEGRRLGNREASRLWLLQRGREETLGGQRWLLAVALGDPKRTARPLLDQAIAARPTDGLAYLVRGALDRMEGRGEDAIADAKAAYERAAEPGTRSAAAELAGDELALAGKGSEALPWLRRAVADAPEPGKGHVAMRAAKTARKIGDEESARDLFRTACRTGNDEACKEIGAEAAERPPDRPRLRPFRRRPGA